MFLSDVQWKNILFSFSLLHVSNLRPTQSQRKADELEEQRLHHVECDIFFPLSFESIWSLKIICVYDPTQSIDGSINHFEMQLA